MRRPRRRRQRSGRPRRRRRAEEKAVEEKAVEEKAAEEKAAEEKAAEEKAAEEKVAEEKAGEGSHLECPICFQPLFDDPYEALLCGHVYHTYCIGTYRTIHPNMRCPVGKCEGLIWHNVFHRLLA
jgi:hypothetical protein